MNLCTSFVELISHGVVLEGSGQTGCLALVTLLLLAPSDVQNLGNYNCPEDDPDDQDALECVVLSILLAIYAFAKISSLINLRIEERTWSQRCRV